TQLQRKGAIKTRGQLGCTIHTERFKTDHAWRNTPKNWLHTVFRHARLASNSQRAQAQAPSVATVDAAFFIAARKGFRFSANQGESPWTLANWLLRSHCCCSAMWYSLPAWRPPAPR